MLYSWSKRPFGFLRIALFLGLGGMLSIAYGCSDPPFPKREKGLEDAARKSSAQTDQVNHERLLAAPIEGDNWLTHGRTYAEDRFSPLDDINENTVHKLSLEWYYDLDTSRGQEATPIVKGDRLYTTSAWSKVQAFNAITGDLLWQYDPKVPGQTAVKACCDVVNRGVALWKGRLYAGTLDGRLIALDAETGNLIWEVIAVDQDKAYTITGAPRVVKGKVLIGNGGGEFGVRGYITAFDAETGDKVWRFFTVPGNPDLPLENDIHAETIKTWNGEWWTLGGGGTVWDSMAYDPDLDLLYIGVGNGSPWNQRIRSPGGGDNLFLSSIVALKPDTGDYVWHYQTTPGDMWDYTATQQIILTDLKIKGENRRVLMQAPKNGFFYVLDRITGELLSAEPFVPVNWASHVDKITGRPAIVPEANYGTTGKPWLALPGPLGAHNWHSMTYSKDTGLVYIPAQELGFPYINDTDFEPKKLAVNLGVDLAAASLPQDAEIKKAVLESVKGHLLAWDPVQQKEIWRVQYPGPWNGGILSTAGNLVFQGTASGFFNAYRATDGEKLWSYPVQTGIVAAPVSFKVAGNQYVAIVAGWGGIFPILTGEIASKSGKQINHSRVLVFKLEGEAALPDRLPDTFLPPKPPARFGDDAILASGKKQYHRFCAGCHGDAAVGGGVLPDLRHSHALATAEDFAIIVRDGALTDNGMVGFAAELTDEDSENIRAYVISRAHDL